MGLRFRSWTQVHFVTSLEWQGSRVGGGGGGGSIHISLVCPLREMRTSLSKPAERRAKTGGANFSASSLKPAESGLVCGRWTRRSSVGPWRIPGSRAWSGATAGGCEGSHIWAKYSLLSPAGRPAINSAGGGTEINAEITVQPVKQAK